MYRHKGEAVVGRGVGAGTPVARHTALGEARAPFERSSVWANTKKWPALEGRQLDSNASR